MGVGAPSLLNAPKGKRSFVKDHMTVATGQPLAVVTPVPSDLTTLVSSWGLAPTPHADETGFLSLLDGLFDGQSQLEGLASKYTRQALTRELAQHLNAMVAKNH